MRLRSCHRFLRFRLRPDDLERIGDKWGLHPELLSPLLNESGSDFERDVEEKIEQAGHEITAAPVNNPDFLPARITSANEPEVIKQGDLAGPLGNHHFLGTTDLAKITPNPTGPTRLAIADIKASRTEKTEHRLQIAAYAKLLQASVDTPIDLSGQVILKPDAEDELDPDLDAEGFDLEPYFRIVDSMVDPGGLLDQIQEQPFDEVPYHLGYWCDACPYNRHCLHDSAERRDLSLIPQLTAVEKKTLLKSGMRSLEDVARLMDLPKEGWDLTAGKGQAKALEVVRNHWSLGNNIETIVQRSKRALSRFDPEVDNRPFLFKSGYGTMPDDDEHPNLVKVFFDAQRDFLKDRVYLIAGLVSCGDQEELVVRTTTGPPTDVMEQELLVDWILGMSQAVSKLAPDVAAKIHLYCYDRLDQRVMLEALKRHLGDVSVGVPGFFDLMTSHEVLDQPIISFVASEIRTHANTGLVCGPLHDTARMLGFDWSEGERDFRQLFRTKMFDNRKTVYYDESGLHKDEADGSKKVRIESSSRFNSQIPLEYAYTAWKAISSEDAKAFSRFDGVEIDDILAFAGRRVQAIQHMAGRVKRRATGMSKPGLMVSVLGGDASPTGSLKQGLKEFLYMEHHAALQEKLQHYALPLEQRIMTGRSLLVEFIRYDAQDPSYEFRIDFEAVGLDTEEVSKSVRLKAGDWMVMNPTSGPPRSPNQMKHGQLWIVEGVSGDRIVMNKAGNWNSAGSYFRYNHNKIEPRPEEFYVLDEMADELNADKVLDGLDHAESNTLYNRILAGPDDDWQGADMSQFIGFWEKTVPDLTLTSVQEELLARVGAPITLLQGPPGTGKSFTLAAAILGYIVNALFQNEPFRILISCKTHNAIMVAMSSLVSKWTGLTSTLPQWKGGLSMYKVGRTDHLPEPIKPLDPFERRDELSEILYERFLVIGATPGGVHTAMRYALGGKFKPEFKPFDLLVIDEASQMSVPDGILAASGLKDSGNILIVGDHRQLAPIVKHGWQTEERRSKTEHNPHLSLFEFMRDRGFDSLALDQSFRMHQDLSEFVRENVYSRDEIDLFSVRTEKIDKTRSGDPLVAAALDPEHPITLVVHGEASSQQYNSLELDLCERLVRACRDDLGLDGAEGVGVVVPHRAQKAQLSARFPELSVQGAIDTVERFQGGERDVIIVSATASDPDFVMAEAEFLMNLNRLNVAISRPRKKLVVVVSRTVLDLLVSDLELFDQAVVWKKLAIACRRELWSGEVDGYPVRISAGS